MIQPLPVVFMEQWRKMPVCLVGGEGTPRSEGTALRRKERTSRGEWGLSLVGSWRTEPNTHSELAGATEITVSPAFKISSQKAADVVRGVHPRRAG